MENCGGKSGCDWNCILRQVTTLIDKTEEALDKGEASWWSDRFTDASNIDSRSRQVSQAVQLEADLTQVVERLRQDINLEAYGKINLKLSHNL